MGSRGPLADPRSKRSLAGEYGPRRARQTDRLTMPPHVAARPAAAQFWKRHAATLADEGRLRRASADSFSLLAVLWAEFLELTEAVAKNGRSCDGGKTLTADARQLRDTRRDYVALAGRFGLTASDDARLGVEDDAADDDALGEFLARHG